MRIASNLFLLLALPLWAIRCEEEESPEFVFMIFEIPINILPPTGELRLGDTLWISGQFPDTLLEYYSREYHQLRDFDFKSRICVASLANNQLYYGDQPGAKYFSILNQVGGLTNMGSLCGDIHFRYEPGRYSYKIGLVPTATGVFSVLFLMPVELHGLPEESINLSSVITLEPTKDGRARVPVYEAFFFVVNTGETHFDLFTQFCRAGSLENTDFRNVYAEQKGTFTFRVDE